MAKKSGLGKGLSSLIPEGLDKDKLSEGVTEISINEITPNPNQPRTKFDENELDELKESIKLHGIIQPIIIRKIDNGYQIIAGERRWSAAKKAGLSTVPCRLMEVSDVDTMKLALIENLQRTDLNPLEEARGYKALIQETGMTQEELAKTVSKSRSAIANTMRLLDLPEEIQGYVFEKKLSAGHARAILSLPNKDQRIDLANKIIEKKLSVRETERIIPLLAAKNHEKPSRRPIPRSYKIAARALRDKLDTNVRVKSSRGRNRIEIEFNDEDDLARILNELGGNNEI